MKRDVDEVIAEVSSPQSLCISQNAECATG